MRYLAPWPVGRFNISDHPEVHQQLPQCLSRESSLHSRFPDDVPSFSEIAVHIKTTETGTSTSSAEPITTNDEIASVEKLHAKVDAEVPSGKVQERKAALIDFAIDDIKIGLYQWKLFALCGSGWFCDNIWFAVMPILLPQLVPEFDLKEGVEGYTVLSAMIGLCIGAPLWGVVGDMIGRAVPFHMTLLIAGVFGIAMAFASSWVVLCAFVACVGVGVGGNLPIDAALFVEFLPKKNSNLLPFMSMFWGLGAIYTAGWGYHFIPTQSCAASGLLAGSQVDDGVAYCTREFNVGWRNLALVLGCTTSALFVCRLMLVHLFESPKILMSKGRQHEAVEVVRGLAWYNGKTTWLSEELLNSIGGASSETISEEKPISTRLQSKFRHLSDECLTPLFTGTRQKINTVLVWFCWTILGIAMPLFAMFLPGFLAKTNHGTVHVPIKTVYRSIIVINLVGMFGCPVASFLVSTRLGRKYTMAVPTMLAGILICVFMQAETSGQQMAMTCLLVFYLNMAYSVLYAYTPESFPTKARGTGFGVASGLNRVGSLIAPILAVNVGQGHAEPLIVISGVLVLVASACMFILPIETRGRRGL